MRMFSRLFFAMTTAAAAFAAGPASAATTIYAQSFTATFAANAPAQTVNGAFSISYDTVSGNSVLSYFSMNIGGTLYDLTNTSELTANFYNKLPVFLIGGSLYGANSMINGTNDFELFYSVWPIGGVRDLSYTTSGTIHFWPSSALSVTAFAPIAVSVPEPATWILMLAGFGAIGGAMRRRHHRDRILAQG